MKTIIKSIFLLTAASILFSSCGVLYGGSRYQCDIIVKDHPEAQIFINGTEHGKGTIAELFKRKDSLTVEVREPGCEPKTQTIHRTLRTGSFILSCVVWVLVGGIVDLSTGAAYKPDHKHDPSIKKIDFKEFEFTIDYTGCTAKKQ